MNFAFFRESGTRQRGFTLTELVIVMIITGILAVVAIARFSGRVTFDTRAYADQVRSALQYAQSVESTITALRKSSWRSFRLPPTMIITSPVAPRVPHSQ